MYGDRYQQDNPETAHTSQTTARTHQRERSDVVLVYDDPDISFILAHTLEKMGYQAESASYNRGRLSGLRERGYRLAVVQVKMADANRLRTLQTIPEANPGLKVIMNDGRCVFEILYFYRLLTAFLPQSNA